jgi:septin family protein
MTPPRHTSKRVSRSSQSPSVRRTIISRHDAYGNILTQMIELDEEGTRISLTIVDTPGFGDQIDNEAR